MYVYIIFEDKKVGVGNGKKNLEMQGTMSKTLSKKSKNLTLSNFKTIKVSLYFNYYKNVKSQLYKCKTEKKSTHNKY